MCVGKIKSGRHSAKNIFFVCGQKIENGKKFRWGGTVQKFLSVCEQKKIGKMAKWENGKIAPPSFRRIGLLKLTSQP